MQMWEKVNSSSFQDRKDWWTMVFVLSYCRPKGCRQLWILFLGQTGATIGVWKAFDTPVINRDLHAVAPKKIQKRFKTILKQGNDAVDFIKSVDSISSRKYSMVSTEARPSILIIVFGNVARFKVAIFRKGFCSGFGSIHSGIG
jgi:hypothetical protein